MTSAVTFVGAPFEALRFVYTKTRGIWPTAIAVAPDGYVYADILSSFWGVTQYTLYPFDLSAPDIVDMRPYVTVAIRGDKLTLAPVGLQAVDLVKRLTTLPGWAHRIDEYVPEPQDLPEPEEPMHDLEPYDACCFGTGTGEVLRLTDTDFIYKGVSVPDGGAAKQAFMSTLILPPINPRVSAVPPSDSHDAFLGESVRVAPDSAVIQQHAILLCTGDTGELLRLTTAGMVHKGVLIDNPLVAQATWMAVMAELHHA